MNYALSDLKSGECMQWVRFFVVALFMFLPATGSTKPEPYVCDGKYKDGGKPDQAELEEILNDHIVWLISGAKVSDTGRANLCGANLRDEDLKTAQLRKANLRGSHLGGADLRNADLRGANLKDTNLIDADLNNADLRGAYLNRKSLEGVDLERFSLMGVSLSGEILVGINLSGADLGGADLRDANLVSADLRGANLNAANLAGTDLRSAQLMEANLLSTNLSNAKLIGVNLENALFSPIEIPDRGYLAGIQNLDTVRFPPEKQSGLALLRNSLKELGLRKLEREATFAIEKGKTGHTASQIEKFARYLFFEVTAGYGLYPGRCLIILFSLIPLFLLIYFFSIYKTKESPKQDKNGIYRNWADDRVRKDLGSDEPELIAGGFMKSLVYAFYFSLLSAFHIGWRDINVGNWIARIQPREYTLRATGWARTVSGIQSLISIYLLAFWVLTQFGRPFG